MMTSIILLVHYPSKILFDYIKKLTGNLPRQILQRSEMISRQFKVHLELEFVRKKRPTDYSEDLNISTVYLNECVKNTTGKAVSYHIHQRVILEAKRFLYHSSKSVKEIATELGYEDHSYFSRLFKKVTGISALAFKIKNLE